MKLLAVCILALTLGGCVFVQPVPVVLAPQPVLYPPILYAPPPVFYPYPSHRAIQFWLWCGRC